MGSFLIKSRFPSLEWIGGFFYFYKDNIEKKLVSFLCYIEVIFEKNQ